MGYSLNDSLNKIQIVHVKCFPMALHLTNSYGTYIHIYGTFIRMFVYIFICNSSSNSHVAHFSNIDFYATKGENK